ncbi:MAG: DUF2142 domain-containing protein [Anaerolineae bacterium]|nr:DUF2142 domain-containing protein [Anaerolineae bacterium]
MRTRWILAAILIAYLAVAVAFSVATPVFEAPDEPEHFFYARYLAQTGRLPVAEKGALWAQEATQPPLYYALTAAVIAGVDTSDAEALAQRNPHAAIGVPLYPDNKNAYVHTDAERFPWRGTVLAVHLARLVSVLLGVITVWMTHLVGRETGFGAAASLTAAAVVAFLPQFGFISGAVNNDNLVTALCAVGLWALLRHLRLGPSPRRGVVLGILAGLATLSKLSGAGLLGLFVAAGLWQALRRRERAWLRDASIVVAVWVVLTGLWFARNAAVYGDLTATSRMVEMMGRRAGEVSFATFWGELRGLVGSFWGLFGWFNVPAPDAMYRMFNLAALAALAGWGLRLVRRQEMTTPRAVVWLALWALIVLAALAQWTARTLASQGRLIFPALPALAVLLAAGWEGIWPRRARGAGMAALALVFLFWAARAPLFTVRPTYAPPPTVPERALPASLVPLDARIGDVAFLLGYQARPDTVRSGEWLTVTLCWRPFRRTEVNYSVYIHLLGRGGKIVGQRDTYPAGGRLATSAWDTTGAFCNDVQVPIAPDAEGPAVLRLTAGLYDLRTGDRLPVYDGWNRPTVVMEEVARLVSASPDAREPAPALARLGGLVELVDWRAEALPNAPGRVVVRLWWRAVAAPSADYTAFVHVVDADGNIVAQHDGIPAAGDYPTRWWLPGQVVEDVHILGQDSPISPGAYMIRAGLYRTDTHEPLLLEDGAGAANGYILLGAFTVP